jgi:hypothetical protein
MSSYLSLISEDYFARSSGSGWHLFYFVFQHFEYVIYHSPLVCKFSAEKSAKNSIEVLFM